ncbi:hypothetical protein R6Q59_010038 [Mikania micrantha]
MNREFQRMREQIATLQDQVNDLYTNINDLRSRQDLPSQGDLLFPPESNSGSISMSRTLPPLMSPKKPQQKPLPQFHGPTSSTYGFDVARSSLQTMGISHNNGEDGLVSRERSRAASPMQHTPMSASAHPSKDPIWLIDHNEALRLVRLYEEEIHIMYPIFDLDKLIKHLNLLYSFIGAAIRSGFAQNDLPGEDSLDDDQTTILKMVLACALIVEGSGRSDLGQRMFESAKLATDLVLVGPLSLKAIILIVVTASYHFQKDEETQAWRFIGIAGRLCVEMGLHRKDSLIRTFKNEAEYEDAIRKFWVVYSLDRRFSFGTGMPFALQDSDIDPNLPEPDDTFLYLKYMTRHNKIATRIWQFNTAFESGSTAKTDKIGFLDYQVQQWYSSLPASLKFYENDLARENEILNRGQRRLRFLMYLRKNQARTSIYRPIMHSATSILQNKSYADTVVGIAKDTINTITGVNRVSDIYRTQQVCFNYFLVQALAAIFLAVAHAPATYCHSTRHEFYSAIDLIKGFSTKSHTSKRLWRTIRGLKEIGDKIGMLEKGGMSDQEHDAHSNAAMAMAGLAGHKVDQFSYPRASVDELGVSPQDGQQMGNELSALFEMAGAYGTNFGNMNGENGYGFANGDGQGIDSFNALLGHDPEFTRIMNDLF